MLCPRGHFLTWHAGHVALRRWCDPAERIGPEFDLRPEAEIAEEYMALLEDSVALRFRSDVSVGIKLSGGVDSAALLAGVQRARALALTSRPSRS
jgi:asparagine synthase (glutamine-hydrolysing)